MFKMAAKVQWDTTHDDVIKEYNSTKLLWDEAFENTNPNIHIIDSRYS